VEKVAQKCGVLLHFLKKTTQSKQSPIGKKSLNLVTLMLALFSDSRSPFGRNFLTKSVISGLKMPFPVKRSL
jgi:hypothetical protein